MLNFGEFAVYEDALRIAPRIFENVVNTEVLIYKTDVSRNPYSVRKT